MEAGKPRIMVVSFSSEGAPRTWQTLLWERAGRGCTLQMEPSGGGRPVQGKNRLRGWSRVGLQRSRKRRVYRGRSGRELFLNFICT